MNYQEMSDFEINCRVHFRNYDKLRFEKGKFYYSDRSGREMVIGKYLYKINHPDYCNSWADAGPIIQEYGISIIKLRTKWMAISQGSGVELYIGEEDDPCLFGGATESKDENQLRAAMIVFLMMKGGE